uniref:Uncharacterized protein n=1 Tax=Parascaris equorum TaxID=6256 RepID=A0A914R204_PAREQ
MSEEDLANVSYGDDHDRGEAVTHRGENLSCKCPTSTLPAHSEQTIRIRVDNRTPRVYGPEVLPAQSKESAYIPVQLIEAKIPQPNLDNVSQSP